MKKIFFAHRNAFSLMELFIAMMLIAIFASFIAPNVASQSRTAKQEAQRLAAFLISLSRKADRRHTDLIIKFESDKVSCNSDEFILTQGFVISQNFSENKLVYDSNENEFASNGTIKIISSIKKDKKNYYHIHIREGRVRISESEKDLNLNSEEI